MSNHNSLRLLAVALLVSCSAPPAILLPGGTGVVVGDGGEVTGAGGGTTGSAGGTTGSAGGTTGSAGGTAGSAGGTPSNLAGDTCSNALPLSAGATNGSTVGMADDYNLSPFPMDCTGRPTPGADVVYRLGVPPGQRAKLKLSTALPVNQFDPALMLFAAPASNCSAGVSACLMGSDQDGAVETASWTNQGTAVADLFIVVDSVFPVSPAGANVGTFTLEVAFETPSPGDTCTSSTPLTPGVALSGQSFAGATDDYQSIAGNCRYSPAPERAFSVQVADGQTVKVAVTPGAALDAQLSVADSAAACGATCLAVARSDGNAGQPDSVVFTNRTGSSRLYYLIVEAFYGTGTFSILATAQASPTDDTCAGATALPLGTTLTNQTTVGYSNDYGEPFEFGTGCAFEGVTGGDRVYQLTVPAGQRGVVTTTAAVGFNPSLSFVEAPASNCELEPRRCVAGVGNYGARTFTLSHFNASPSPVTLFAEVDSAGAVGGTFSIGYAASTPAPNDTCTTATATVSPAAAVTGNLTGYTMDYSTGDGCPYQGGGADRVYRITVPPQQSWEVAAQPTNLSATTGPQLQLGTVRDVATCESTRRRCLAASSAHRGETARVRVSNSGAAPKEVLLVVGDFSPNTVDTRFTLTTTSTPVLPGESCENAVPLTTSGPQTLSFSGFDRSYAFTSPTCKSYGEFDRVFSVQLAAGGTFTASAEALPGANIPDLALDLIDGTTCADTSTCVASSSVVSGSGQSPASVSFTNSTGQSRSLLLVVGGTYQASFKLTTSL